MRPLDLIASLFMAWCAVLVMTHDMATLWKNTTRQAPTPGLMVRFILYPIIGIGIGFLVGTVLAEMP